MLPIVILAIENDDDREFMSMIYYQYNRLMFSEANKIVQNDADAEDIVQDVIEKLIDKIDVLRVLAPRQLTCYVAESAKNRARNFMRSTVNCPLPIDALDQAGKFAEDVELAVLRSVSVDELRIVLKNMKETTSELLRMKYLLQLSNDEIAKELRVKPDSVRALLSRARKEAFTMLKELSVE